MDYTTAGLGGAVGLVLGLAIGASNAPEISDIEKMVTGAASETASAVDEGLASLRDEITGVGSAIDEAQSAAAEAQSAAGEKLDALQEGLTSLGEDTTVADGMSALDEKIAALSEQLSKLETDMASRFDALGSGDGGGDASTQSEQPSESGAETEVEAEEEAAEVEPEPEGIRPGSIDQLADGALRVFVSGVSEDEQVVRIAINGVETTEVRVGRSAELEIEGKPCTVSIDGVDRGHVQMSGSCED